MDLREQLNKVKQTSSKRAEQVKVLALYSGFVFGTGECLKLPKNGGESAKKLLKHAKILIELYS